MVTTILGFNNIYSTTTTIANNNNMPIYHFKLLVPAAAAGRIIGKGGTTIAQLQKDAGARVKMSKASEFYPGTTERVCLISGPIEGILKINDFFMENFNPSTPMKILVPNSTAGMIIGKGGSYIKQIKDESGAYVQISQKCTDFSLPERCVTIVGELESIRIACSMILNKIVEDNCSTSVQTSLNLNCLVNSTNNHHHHHQNQNQIIGPNSPTKSTASSSTSSSLSSSSFSANSPSLTLSSSSPCLSSPMSNQLFNRLIEETNTTTTPTNNLSSPVSQLQQQHQHQLTSSSSPSLLSTSASTSTSTSTSTSSSSSSQIIETIKLVLQVSGYAEDAVSEISSAMFTLANHGVLGLGLGLF